MARINIEDSIYKDHRFVALMQKTGDYWKALGLLVGAWSLAQKHYLDESNDRLIPFKDWQRTCFEVLVEVGLAEVREKGIYIKGADSQFGWLVQRSNAGKSSAQSRKSMNDRSTDVQRKATVEQPLTLTLTPTLTPTLKNSNIKTPAVRKKLTPDQSELNSKIWQAYSQAYHLRYKVEPTRNDRTNSQISSLRQRLGVDALEIVKFYLRHNDKYYIQKLHPIGLCLHDAEALATQWKRGQAVTEADARAHQKTHEHQSQWDRMGDKERHK